MSDATNPAPKFRMPYKFKIEPRLENPPRWFSPLLSLAAVIFALLIGALVIQLGGGSPWKAYTHIALINTAILLSEWSAKRKKINHQIPRKKWL